MNHKSKQLLTLDTLSDLIVMSKAIGMNHPVYATRLRVRMTTVIISYLDATEPHWRQEAIDRFNATPDAEIGDFFELTMADVSLELSHVTLKQLKD